MSIFFFVIKLFSCYLQFVNKTKRKNLYVYYVFLLYKSLYTLLQKCYLVFFEFIFPYFCLSSFTRTHTSIPTYKCIREQSAHTHIYTRKFSRLLLPLLPPKQPTNVCKQIERESFHCEDPTQQHGTRRSSARNNTHLLTHSHAYTHTDIKYIHTNTHTHVHIYTDTYVCAV